MDNRMTFVASAYVDVDDLTEEQIERLKHHADISRRVYEASIASMAKGVRKYGPEPSGRRAVLYAIRHVPIRMPIAHGCMPRNTGSRTYSARRWTAPTRPACLPTPWAWTCCRRATMTNIADMIASLEDEIQGRLDTLANMETLQTEVEALRMAVAALRGSPAPPSEPEPEVDYIAQAVAAVNEFVETRKMPPAEPDPDLVAIFNDQTRPDALRQIAAERGQIVVSNAALALFHSTSPGKGSDLQSCKKAIANTIQWTKAEWLRIGAGVWEHIDPQPEEPAPPKIPTPACPKCGGNVTRTEATDRLGNREMVTMCRQCGHAAPEGAP